MPLEKEKERYQLPPAKADQSSSKAVPGPTLALATGVKNTFEVFPAPLYLDSLTS